MKAAKRVAKTIASFDKKLKLILLSDLKAVRLAKSKVERKHQTELPNCRQKDSSSITSP